MAKLSKLHMIRCAPQPVVLQTSKTLAVRHVVQWLNCMRNLEGTVPVTIPDLVLEIQPLMHSSPALAQLRILKLRSCSNLQVTD